MSKGQLLAELTALKRHTTVKNHCDSVQLVNGLHWWLSCAYDESEGVLCGISNKDSSKITKTKEDRVTVVSFKKWVEWAIRFQSFTNNWTIYGNLEEIIPLLSTAWGEVNSPKTYTFDVVRGKEIVRAYCDGPKSCMSGEGRSQQVQFYADNANIELVKINEDGEFIGRALLWTLHNGNKFLDRVYPSDGGKHTQVVRKWALDQGWAVRDRDSAGESYSQGAAPAELYTEVTAFTGQRQPYLDTFDTAYADETGRIFIGHHDAEVPSQVWTDGFSYDNSDENNPYRNWIKEGLFGKKAPVWELVSTLDGFAHKDDLHRFVKFGDEWGLPENVMYCNLSGALTHRSLMVNLYHGGHYYNVSPDEVVSQEQVHSACRGDAILRRYAVLLTGGFGAGTYVSPQYVAERNGEQWYTGELATLDFQANFAGTVLCFNPLEPELGLAIYTNWTGSMAYIRNPYETITLDSGATVYLHHYGRNRWFYYVQNENVEELYMLLLAARTVTAQAAD